ncbi:hypothetical protein [Sphingomonas sp.]|uniref:hypothetical protein n=1 Tax=Sphingomonas sp. TaxID=28214 RepID=UPI001B12446C|nr:hypothetical protein [Sphingomonas sp.]MBO9714608.1 hypothetical protein [Sphingomonas sp.]
MTGYPSFGAALLQGLVTTLVMVGPWLVAPFGGRLRVTAADVGMALAAVGGVLIVTVALFWPFEGDWVDWLLGPARSLRALLVGGFVLLAGMAWFLRRRLARAESAVRLGTAFLLGAAWGSVWSFSGWCLATGGVVASV